jgi:hypothetical protein
MVDQSNSEQPPLGGTKRDFAVAVVKGLAGAIPFAGSIVSELVGKIIPEQRIHRLEDYARFLNERLEKIDQARLDERIRNPQNVDLFEEGAIQSIRALSASRREHIARLVAYGIAGDEKERLEARRLLDLIKEIDDDQIIILTSYLRKHDRDELFRNTHKAILRPERPHINSSTEERERYAVASVARDQLIRLGLLLPQFKLPNKGEMPDL